MKINSLCTLHSIFNFYDLSLFLSTIPERESIFLRLPYTEINIFHHQYINFARRTGLYKVPFLYTFHCWMTWILLCQRHESSCAKYDMKLMWNRLYLLQVAFVVLWPFQSHHHHIRCCFWSTSSFTSWIGF